MIQVRLDGVDVPIHRAVFSLLLENSVAGAYVAYEKTLQSGRIRYADLLLLSERGDIPFSLFFAPIGLVQEQVQKKTDKLLSGISRDTFSIGSRAHIDLRDIELIVKDLIRKQQLVRKHDVSLKRNTVVGALHKLGPSAEDDAKKLMSILGITNDAIKACRTKEKALALLIGCLESNQIMVSRSVPNYMPQMLRNVNFSGLAIRDAKIPYIFLAGGDHKDSQEPVGRTIFTLVLMTVLVARRIFAPMTWNGGNTHTEPGLEYDIAGSILMPANKFREIAPETLEDMKDLSTDFKVTSSAVTVRAMRLGIITGETATRFLGELREEFLSMPRGGPRNKILPENGVLKYNGRELTRRMLQALDKQSISPGEFCRSVCLNNLKPVQIGDLKRAVV